MSKFLPGKVFQRVSVKTVPRALPRVFMAFGAEFTLRFLPRRCRDIVAARSIKKGLYVNVSPGPERTGTVLHAEMLPEQSEKKNTESIITMATASNTCQGCSKNSKQRWRILMMVRDKVNIKLLI